MLPKLYAIVDQGTLDARGIDPVGYARELRDAGVRLLQYRDKTGEPQEVLRVAAEIAEEFAGLGATLILNDRADLALLAGWGVHVGQEDLPVAEARKVLGAANKCVVGVSTHAAVQVAEADTSVADYVAVGPVFATSTKTDAEPVVGLAGVRRARALTSRPLVAIGGITRENARSVVEAGADSVAVISGLLVQGRRVRDVAEDFLKILG